MKLRFTQFHRFFTSKSQGFILALGLSLIIFIGALDYVTGSGLEFDFFYLLPLSIITWYSSTKAALATTVFTTLIWSLANILVGELPPIWTKDLWNISIELVSFLTVVGLLSLLKSEVRIIDELASEDPLTGIANRRSFYRVVVAEMNRSQRFSSSFTIAYIDIDDFKTVNDSQGHNAGDALLRKVATTIREHIRNVDTVARLGGDEFAILFPETNAVDAKQSLERIQAHLNDLVTNHSWPITFSIGAVTFSEPPASVEEIMGFADEVMYSVKKQGKNGIQFTSWPD